MIPAFYFTIVLFGINTCLTGINKIAAGTRWIELESNRHVVVAGIIPAWVITVFEFAWWWLTFSARSWGWVRTASTDDSGDLISSREPVDDHFVLAIFIAVAAISDSLSSRIVEAMIIADTNRIALRVTCCSACITGLSICETVSVTVIGETGLFTIGMSQTIQLNYATFWFCFGVGLFDERGAASVVIFDSVVLTLAVWSVEGRGFEASVGSINWAWFWVNPSHIVFASFGTTNGTIFVLEKFTSLTTANHIFASFKVRSKLGCDGVKTSVTAICGASVGGAGYGAIFVVDNWSGSLVTWLRFRNGVGRTAASDTVLHVTAGHPVDFHIGHAVILSSWTCLKQGSTDQNQDRKNSRYLGPDPDQKLWEIQDRLLETLDRTGSNKNRVDSGPELSQILRIRAGLGVLF